MEAFILAVVMLVGVGNTHFPQAVEEPVVCNAVGQHYSPGRVAFRNEVAAMRYHAAAEEAGLSLSMVCNPA